MTGLSACQSLPSLPLQKVSVLDQHYILEKKISGASAKPSVSIYRNVVAKTLSTHCRWFPSDSRYAQIAQNQCGGVKGGLMSFARFLAEEDATKMGYPVIVNQGHLESVDFAHECWF